MWEISSTGSDLVLLRQSSQGTIIDTSQYPLLYLASLLPSNTPPPPRKLAQHTKTP